MTTLHLRWRLDSPATVCGTPIGADVVTMLVMTELEGRPEGEPCNDCAQTALWLRRLMEKLGRWPNGHAPQPAPCAAGQHCEHWPADECCLCLERPQQ